MKVNEYNKITSEVLYQAIQDQIIPICNSNQGNRFYNTIIEIANNTAGITFNDLIEALFDNKELILPDCYDPADIDNNVINDVYSILCKDLNY